MFFYIKPTLYCCSLTIPDDVSAGKQRASLHSADWKWAGSYNDPLWTCI